MIKNRLQILVFAAALLPCVCALSSCGGDSGASRMGDDLNEVVADRAVRAAIEATGHLPEAMSMAESSLRRNADGTATVEGEVCPAISGALLLLLPTDTIRANNPFEVHLPDMPDECVKIKINGLGGSLSRVFNDSNKYQIESAEANGITPLHTLADVWSQSPRLERLHTCEAYYLDNLTHSMPFLVSKAHKLLTDIGMAFRDSLRSRGGGHYRVKVTSVLRTPSLVKKLRRRNRNAVDTSAHLFGTTFDISYLKFICDSVTDTAPARTQEDLKNLLGEVIEDMRRHGRCYVKYERNQACYHVTVR